MTNGVANMTEKLRACPFCGSEDTERQRGEDGWLAVRCLNCGALGPCVDLTGAGCNAKWNARAQDMEQRAGFVTVPVEMTPAMLQAGEQAWCRHNHGSPYDNELPDIYRSMLAAAPPIEAPEGGKADLGASGALGASGDKGAQA